VSAPVKEILFNAADRTGVLLTLVANHAMALPTRPNVRMLQVAGGFDVADDEITRRVSPGDLVITADIPLAADVIARGAHALNPRGELYSPTRFAGCSRCVISWTRCDRAARLPTVRRLTVHPSARPLQASLIDGWRKTPGDCDC